MLKGISAAEGAGGSMPSRRLIAITLILAFAMAAGSAHVLLTGGIRIRVATTTSLYATGLLDYLAKKFEERYPEIRLEFIATGTGAALRYAERGDACAILAHAPSLEKQYIDRGVLEYGFAFAYNYFIIVGPVDDPAGISGSRSTIEAFEKIYSAGESGEIIFISRGDFSGTHLRELEIWEKAGLNPAGRSWYREAATGMEQTLIIASQLSAYTLTDIGTYLRLRSEEKIQGLTQLYSNPEDPFMINIYSAYIARACSGEERRYAMLFLEFLRESRELIKEFGEREYGQPLFHPVNNEVRELWSELASGAREA